MACVLLIDGDSDGAQAIADSLATGGLTVVVEARGDAGLRRCAEQTVDLVICQRMLVDMTGTEVCRALRTDSQTHSLPVILLSDRGDEIDRIVAFEVGADDFMVTPLSHRELGLRVRAILRRRKQPTPALAGGHDPLAQALARELSLDGHDLSALELRLYAALSQSEGRVLSRRDLLRAVWGSQGQTSERTVDAAVKRLRRKLGRRGQCIQTVRGVGYRLVADRAERDAPGTETR